MRQRVREFEAALEQHRQAIARDTQRRLADIERAAIEELETLESAAADKTAEIHWVTADQREALDQAAATRLAELERAAIEERAAFEELASERLVGLEHALQAQFQALRDELVDEALRIQHDAVERIDQARSLVTSETSPIEPVGAARDDIRRVTGGEAEAVDKRAGQGVLELREAVREQIELLDELTSLHASASEQLDEARALTAGALRSGIEGLRRGIATALWQTGRPERANVAAASAPEVSQPAVSGESSPPVSTPAATGDDAKPPAIHWMAPPAPPPSPAGR